MTYKVCVGVVPILNVFANDREYWGSRLLSGISELANTFRTCKYVQNIVSAKTNVSKIEWFYNIRLLWSCLSVFANDTLIRFYCPFHVPVKTIFRRYFVTSWRCGMWAIFTMGSLGEIRYLLWDSNRISYQSSSWTLKWSSWVWVWLGEK